MRFIGWRGVSNLHRNDTAERWGSAWVCVKLAGAMQPIFILRDGLVVARVHATNPAADPQKSLRFLVVLEAKEEIRCVSCVCQRVAQRILTNPFVPRTYSQRIRCAGRNERKAAAFNRQLAQEFEP